MFIIMLVMIIIMVRQGKRQTQKWKMEEAGGVVRRASCVVSRASY
jgi:hypothetical protein